MNLIFTVQYSLNYSICGVISSTENDRDILQLNFFFIIKI